MSMDEVAKAFTTHYYQCFDSNREGLAGLYREGSSLTFEGDGPKIGPAAIMEKLRSMPPVQHNVTSMDVQTSVNANAIVVMCTGQVVIEQGKPLNFTETFQLVASAPGQYYLHNDVFRLNYA
ncbi:hypothetical protein M885DRAFT_624188 [Pelagophyceae sp. CCMP2097]|nr:hypothetical protein M885DRAFT_624188 [Pelagophyceae sp. CCMP2097]|eukprot:CAMPEP_0184088756 /NCGR_PEP_ID=MMETSP0974-20121125/6383_1 /TAXON_ID=483370 /ORGANISM="non described non described, Strain CCMP2097" /LENGTH=121 /DNA_ID=CAMNT_0026391467 /DNA_START=59 /DNA_END=424 /DNA_ORIENTATION=-